MADHWFEDRSPTTSARRTSATASRRAPTQEVAFLVDAARASAPAPGARRRLRARSPRHSALAAAAEWRSWASTCRHLRRGGPAGRSRSRCRRAGPFVRGDARGVAFDSEFDAAYSLCQGAFGLLGGPASSRRPARRPVRPGRHGPGRAPRRCVVRERLLGVLPGAAPRRRAPEDARAGRAASAFDASSGTNHERTEVKDPDGNLAGSSCGPPATPRVSSACWPRGRSAR